MKFDFIKKTNKKNIPFKDKAQSKTSKFITLMSDKKKCIYKTFLAI